MSAYLHPFFIEKVEACVVVKLGVERNLEFNSYGGLKPRYTGTEMVLDRGLEEVISVFINRDM
jgi:hypothetical protein